MKNKTSEILPPPVEKPPENYLGYLQWRADKLRAIFERLKTEESFKEWRAWQNALQKALRADPEAEGQAARDYWWRHNEANANFMIRPEAVTEVDRTWRPPMKVEPLVKRIWENAQAADILDLGAQDKWKYKIMGFAGNLDYVSSEEIYQKFFPNLDYKNIEFEVKERIKNIMKGAGWECVLYQPGFVQEASWHWRNPRLKGLPGGNLNVHI